MRLLSPKREMKMPSSPGRNCKNCDCWIEFKIERDVTRKNFCSRSCANSFSAKERFKNATTIDQCANCKLDFISKSITHKFCSETCQSKAQVRRSYKYLNNNLQAYVKHLLYKKERSKLSVEYILDLYEKQNCKCAISGIELTCIKIPDFKKVHTNLSIDRIDSSKGYEIGNIQLVCAIVNTMKLTLSKEELVWWCSKICDHSGGVENSIK